MRSLPETIGNYRVVRRIACGGMGDVLEAVEQSIGRRVAIKMLRSELADSAEAALRMFNEARAANRLQHPGLVQLYAHGQTPDGSAYLVMELLPGETLRSRLKRLQLAGARLAVSEVARIGWQVAQALAALHELGVIHRDLKPENLMLVPDPAAIGGERVKVLDFGIAKLPDPREPPTLRTGLLGTPQYMAPEQWRRRTTLDSRVDVYALGIVLYELLAGSPPFCGDSPAELVEQHLFDFPPPLAALAPHATPELADLIQRLLRKTTSERPFMSEVAHCLREVADGKSRSVALAGPILRRDVDRATTTHAQICAPSTRPVLVPPTAPTALRCHRSYWARVVALWAVGGVLLGIGGFGLRSWKLIVPPRGSAIPESAPHGQVAPRSVADPGSTTPVAWPPRAAPAHNRRAVPTAQRVRPGVLRSASAVNIYVD